MRCLWSNQLSSASSAGALMMAEDCRRLVYVTAVLAVAYLLLVDRVHGAVVNSTEDNSTLTYVDAPVPEEPAGHPGSTPRSQYVQRGSCALEEGHYICAIPRICCENNTTCCASCFKDKCALPQKSEKYVRAMICMGFVAFVILFYSFHKRLRRCCKRGKAGECSYDEVHYFCASPLTCCEDNRRCCEACCQDKCCPTMLSEKISHKLYLVVCLVVGVLIYFYDKILSLCCCREYSISEDDHVAEDIDTTSSTNIMLH